MSEVLTPDIPTEDERDDDNYDIFAKLRNLHDLIRRRDSPLGWPAPWEIE